MIFDDNVWPFPGNWGYLIELPKNSWVYSVIHINRQRIEFNTKKLDSEIPQHSVKT